MGTKECITFNKKYLNNGYGNKIWAAGEDKIMRCTMLNEIAKPITEKKGIWGFRTLKVTRYELDVMDLKEDWFGILNRSLRNTYRQARQPALDLGIYGKHCEQWTRCYAVKSYEEKAKRSPEDLYEAELKLCKKRGWTPYVDAKKLTKSTNSGKRLARAEEEEKRRSVSGDFPKLF